MKACLAKDLSKDYLELERKKLERTVETLDFNLQNYRVYKASYRMDQAILRFYGKDGEKIN